MLVFLLNGNDHRERRILDARSIGVEGEGLALAETEDPLVGAPPVVPHVRLVPVVPDQPADAMPPTSDGVLNRCQPLAEAHQVEGARGL